MLGMIFWYVLIFGRVASSIVAFHASVLMKFLIPAASVSVPAVAVAVVCLRILHLLSKVAILGVFSGLKVWSDIGSGGASSRSGGGG